MDSRFLYEYMLNESDRNEIALTVALNNLYGARRVRQEHVIDILLALERKQYFQKISKDLQIVIKIGEND